MARHVRGRLGSSLPNGFPADASGAEWSPGYYRICNGRWFSVIERLREAEGAASEPELGVTAVPGDIVYQQGDGDHDRDAGPYGNDDEQVTEIVNLLAADDGDQAGCAAGRVQGFGGAHEGDGGGYGRRSDQPGMGAEYLVAGG
jgi:hypothetical protein